MLIDVILDRKDGVPYSFKEFSAYCVEGVGLDAPYGESEYTKVIHAFAKGEDAVKNALCDYIDAEGYAPEIKDYVNSVDWLTQPVHQVLRTYIEKIGPGGCRVERKPVSFDFQFGNKNCNEGYAHEFETSYARGIVNGMKCRWKHPLVVVCEIMPDGTEREVNWLR